MVNKPSIRKPPKPAVTPQVTVEKAKVDVCPYCKSQKIAVISAARPVAEFNEPSHNPTGKQRTHVSEIRSCLSCNRRFSKAA